MLFHPLLEDRSKTLGMDFSALSLESNVQNRFFRSTVIERIASGPENS